MRRRAQVLSYNLKMHEFDDLTNTCCPEVDRDRPIVVRGGARKSDSTTPQLHDHQTCLHAQSYTQAPTTHARAGALVFSSSCLDESTSRVGLGQYPQYTRALFGEEAVGSSQTKHHSTPPAQYMSPQQHPTSDGSLAMYTNFSKYTQM